MDFDLACEQCPRLAAFLGEVRRSHPGYHARPVPSFGPEHARLLVVGLAPGMHGANRTGRPFTGDYAGILLYETLHRYGFASHPQALDGQQAANPDMVLADCRITNAVRCLPPQNRPLPAEIRQCNVLLRQELQQLPAPGVVLALGSIAHQAVLMAYGMKVAGHRFAHGAKHELPGGRQLYDSYHCSRYNTQTRRLTAAMFHAVFHEIRQYIDTF